MSNLKDGEREKNKDVTAGAFGRASGETLSFSQSNPAGNSVPAAGQQSKGPRVTEMGEADSEGATTGDRPGDLAGNSDPARASGSGDEQKRLLVISSDTELVSTVKEWLEADDLSVLWFRDSVVDMAVLSQTRPHLIMVEAGSPGLDYDHVIRLAGQAYDPVQVILVLGADGREKALKSLDDGAHDFLEKPIEEKILRNVVRRAIERFDLLLFKRDHRQITLDQIQEKTMEISERRDFLQGILDSSTLVSVVLTDLDQNVLFWNKGAENIFGYKAQEIIGTKITQLYPPDSITTDRVEELRTMLQTKSGTVYGKMKQLTKDGRELTVSLAISPMVDQSGNLRGLLGVGLDVTAEVHQQNEILRLLEQVKTTKDVAIFSLAKLAESRDEETGSHLMRIQGYCRALCRRLAQRRKYRPIMTRQYIEDLVRSSVLHDIGKVAIPDSILLSRGKFGPKERQIMKQHSIVGGRALEEAVEKLGGEKSFLTLGMEVAYYHHERWDGYGYPFAKKGEEIPLSARIVAVADVYDALTTPRRYKEAFTHEQARSMILEGKEKQFDPELVEAFDEIEGEFAGIRSSI